MYDGTNDIEDEVRQNARDQQHPITRAQAIDHALRTEQFALPRGPVTAIPGLSTRQMELINNVDNGQPNQGEARKHRLEVIVIEMDYIERILPKLEVIRTYLEEMLSEDEDLIEAKRLVDSKVRAFIKHVTGKRETLQLELDIKRAEE